MGLGLLGMSSSASVDITAFSFAYLVEWIDEYGTGLCTVFGTVSLLTATTA